MKVFHTKSGSIYEVTLGGPIHDGAVHVRRRKLGEKHNTPDRIARRKADGIDDGRLVSGFKCDGVGSIAVITIAGADDRLQHIYTSPVTRIEDTATGIAEIE